MSAVLMRIKPRFKKCLYAFLTCSWFTGVVFFVLNTWVRVAGDFGPEKHPAQFKVLVIHGVSAFVMLMLLGAVFFNHVPLGWRSKRLRYIGLSLLSFASIQIVTALFLYYLANETVREWAMYVHLLTGLFLPLLLLIHVRMAKQQKTSAVR